MAFVRIHWRPSPRELRRFGVVMLAGFGMLGLLFQWVLPGPVEAAWVCYVLGGVAGLTALTGTAVGLPFYWLWTGIGFVVGNVVGRIALAVVYYGLFTPMGVVMRLMGRDPLNLRRKTAETWWQDIAPSERRRDERQY